MTRSELMPSDSYPELHAEGGVVGFERRIERLVARARGRAPSDRPQSGDSRGTTDPGRADGSVHLQAAFEHLADRLHRQEIRPRLEAVARCLAGTEVEHLTTLAGTLSLCTLPRTDRFPAATTLSVGIVFDSARMAASVVCGVRTVPVILELERIDGMPVRLEEPPVEAVAAWLDRMLEGFAETYVRVEGDTRCEQGERLTDPVCGMDVAAATAVRADYGGRAFYFCAPACRTTFEAEPGRFADRRAAVRT